MKQDYQTVDVQLSDRGYPIYIGNNLLAQPEIWLPQNFLKRKCFIITDEQVNPHHAEPLSRMLQAKGILVQTLVLPAGEKTKSFANYQQVLEWLLSNGVNRSSFIIAVGGGVIGDLAGFVAATVLRGIDFIQVPTTLLSQVDSSVGGKTGINSPQGKNLIGAFYQPKCVVIDTQTLKTLPPRETLAGYAEIIKYGLLGDVRFFEWLLESGSAVCRLDEQALVHAITTSCKMKAEIVRQDEREENGLRALLNLGHTFAHVFETACEYDGRLLHGEAVGIGLVQAARLSVKQGLISEDDVTKLKSHLQSLGMMTEASDIKPAIRLNAEELLQLMFKDKKASNDNITFITLQKIGRAKTDNTVKLEDVISILKATLNE